jgi:hypothetical protein
MPFGVQHPSGLVLVDPASHLLSCTRLCWKDYFMPVSQCNELVAVFGTCRRKFQM